MTQPLELRPAPPRRVLLVGRFPQTSHATIKASLAALSPPVHVTAKPGGRYDAVFCGVNPGRKRIARAYAAGVPVCSAGHLFQLIAGSPWEVAVDGLSAWEHDARPINATLSVLRASFNATPNRASWLHVCAALKRCPDHDLPLAQDYIQQASGQWDAAWVDALRHDATSQATAFPSPFRPALCPTPSSWYAALTRGATDPRLASMRHLDVKAWFASLELRQAWRRHAFPGVGALLRRADITRLRWVDVGSMWRGWYWPESRQFEEVLRELERQDHLIGLNLERNNVGSNKGYRVLRQARLETLGALELSHNRPSLDILMVLGGRARALRWLGLHRCRVGAAGLVHLARLAAFERLVGLDLGAVWLPEQRWAPLAHRAWPSLEVLRVTSKPNPRLTQGTEVWGDAVAMPNLRSLHLNGWALHGAALAKMACGERLRALNVDQSALDAPEALARSPHLSGLRALSLRAPADPDLMVALLEAAAVEQAWPELEALDLSRVPVTARLRRALAACTHWKLRAFSWDAPSHDPLPARLGWTVPTPRDTALPLRLKRHA